MSYISEGDEQERKLFVGGFSKSSTEEENLKTYFENYGGIVDCTILRDSEKRSRGFGFVLFDISETVDKIMRSKKSGTRFTLDDGETYMEVKRALPKGSRDSNSRDNRPSIQSRPSYNKIFVGGLPSSITEEELRKYFESFGRVNQIELLRDRETSRLRGFAFVSFEDEDSADKCIQRRSHEICRKICEVKRAHTRDKDTGASNNNSGRQSDNSFNDRRDRDSKSHQIQAATNNNLGGDVNALIQQAYLMGQQSVYQQAGLQAPTIAQLSLASGAGVSSAIPGMTANPMLQHNNILLQALAGQQVAPPVAIVPNMVTPTAHIAPSPSVSNSTDTLTQLAQLLQGGLDPNALGALLNKSEPTAQSQPQRVQPVASVGSSSNGYSTVYPGVYNQSNTNYGPTSKYEDPKRQFRPY